MKTFLAIGICMLMTGAIPAWGLRPGVDFRATGGGGVGPASAPRQRNTTAVVYKDAMLIVATKDGVAAIMFGDEIEDGVKFRYRLLRTGSDKVETGDGQVFVKYQRFGKPAKPNAGGTGLIRAGGQTALGAGPVSVDWDYKDQGQGFISYTQDDANVQVVKPADFESVDLKRFAK